MLGRLYLPSVWLTAEKLPADTFAPATASPLIVFMILPESPGKGVGVGVVVGEGEGVGEGVGDAVAVGVGPGEGLAVGVGVTSWGFARGDGFIVEAGSGEAVMDGTGEDVSLIVGVGEGVAWLRRATEDAGVMVTVGVGFTVTLSADLVGSGAAAPALCNCGDAAEIRMSTVSITLNHPFANRCTDFILASYIPAT